MPRDTLVLLAFFAIGAASVLGYSYLADAHPTRSPDIRIAAFSATRAEPSSGMPPPEVAARPERSDKRAKALATLARPSGIGGIPALEKAIRTGEDAEREVALSSLRELAQTHGDEDQRIRSSLRETISHTSNEALILSAQETLDQIEQDLVAAAQASGL
jgi:hypothetical protein